MNGMVLLLMSYMEGKSLSKEWKKILLIAGISTFLEVVLLLLLENYLLFSILSFLVVLPGMLLWFFGRMLVRLFVKRYIMAIFETFLLGGVVTGLVNLTGWQESLVWIGMLAGGIGLCMSKMIYERWKKVKHIFPVGLILGEKEIWVQGLYDSGNCLTTGQKGESVHIVEGSILKKLGILPETPFFYQSFSSLGNKQGFIKIYEIDEMIIQMEQKKIYQKVKVAEETQGILRRKEYKVILNAAIEGDISLN